MSKCSVNKEKFDKQIKKFVENGYVTILFQNEEYALCNYANQCYLLFPHGVCDYGIIINKTNLIACVENPVVLLNQIAKLPDDVFRKNTVVIDDKLFEHARLTKIHTDKNGPSEFIDLSGDEFIIANYGMSGRRK